MCREQVTFVVVTAKPSTQFTSLLAHKAKKFRIEDSDLVSSGKQLPAFWRCVVPLYFACCFVWV